jgi:hypothetical protein
LNLRNQVFIPVFALSLSLLLTIGKNPCIFMGMQRNEASMVHETSEQSHKQNGIKLSMLYGWGVIVLGAAVIYFSIPYILRFSSTLSNPDSDIPQLQLVRWQKELLGQKIILQEEDSQGYAISKDRNYLVISIPGSGCFSFSPIIESTNNSKHLPYILLLSSKEGCFKEDWIQPVLHQPEKFLVVLDSEAKIAPVTMHNFAPQAVWLSSDGEIISIPSDSQLLEDFLVKEVK